MDYPVILRTTSVVGSDTDVFIINPNRQNGLVARVYNDRIAARLLSASPDLKYALEAILRVEISNDGDFPTCADALAEVRSIAIDALASLAGDTSDQSSLGRNTGP